MYAPKRVMEGLLSALTAACESKNRKPFGTRRLALQVKRIWQGEEGKDVVEYGLLMVLLSLAGITALLTLARAFGLLGSQQSHTLSTS